MPGPRDQPPTRSRDAPSDALLLDVHGGESPGTIIVKLGDKERLRREHAAFHGSLAASPSGLVFMHQYPRPDADNLVAIVYQDARAYVAGDRQLSLEDAFLLWIRFNALDGPSLGRAVTALFHRLHDVLYKQAYGREEPTRCVELNWYNKADCRHEIRDAFAVWEKGDLPQHRRQVNAAIPHSRHDFLDPVDFFRFVDDELRAGNRKPGWLPALLRGDAHGDLHGRNVLVGVRDVEGDDQVVAPALFDYEHMARDHLVGWDFVKLETELKIRAYRPLFRDVGPSRSFVRAGHEFELELADRFEKALFERTVPVCQGERPRERLLNLLVLIRYLAGQALGPADWKAEYYFLLSGYGVATAWYDNQSPEDRLGTLTSTGVAAARFAFWHWRSTPLGRLRSTDLHETGEAVLTRRHPSYRAPLQVAWAANRSGARDRLADAHRLLEGLAGRYPHALHVRYELAYGLAQRGERKEALQILDDVADRFRDMLDEDTLSLRGRCFKNLGDELLAKGLALPEGSPQRRKAPVPGGSRVSGRHLLLPGCL